MSEMSYLPPTSSPGRSTEQWQLLTLATSEVCVFHDIFCVEEESGELALWKCLNVTQGTPMYTSPEIKQPYGLQGKPLSIPAETFWFPQATLTGA